MKHLPLYEKIYKDISDAINRGDYKPGDKLPSEKELTEKYNVSRITSKKSLEMLSDEGRIVRMPGKGSFVTNAAVKLKGHSYREASADNSDHENRLPENAKFGDDDQQEKEKFEIRLIGVIMEGFGNGFGSTMLNSIERECRKKGLTMLFRCSDGSVDEETKAIDDFIKANVKGMIIMCAQDENYNPRILQLVVEHFPVVTIDRQMKGIPVSHVGTNNIEASRKLTECLLDQGCRGICFVKPDADNTSTLQERIKGFNQAMNEHGIITDASNYVTNLKATLPKHHFQEMIEQDKETIYQHLTEYPQTEAFFAAEYGIALILYQCLLERGVEKKYPIVCFDSNDNITGQYPFLHVQQGEEEIGKGAVDTLLDVMKGERNVRTIMVPYEIKR
ncbi:GntR family transcriptional regulator [Blautia liquoris]|uniref:GntR family transcriptional regulator n=1 Tax=Blautia liquoris TaxID=2779518 RepID=A0A7M2RI06_9FIRM|nr:GntR family transcriptional regulator [Blautia liquoris]QOV19889.1 GntR family transcriptional regulator [Blautia liquoris]